MPELVGDNRFDDAEKRWQNRLELDRIIEEEYTQLLPAYDVLPPIRREGIKAELAAGPRDFSKPPQYKFLSPLGPYRCQDIDQWITLTVTRERQWQALCKAMGRTELITDEKFKDNKTRYENQDELNQIIDEWTATQTHLEVFYRLQRAGIPSGPALTMPDVLTEPQHRARGLYQTISHPETCPYLEPNHAWLMSETPRKLERPSPCLGEHNDFVYGQILGMSKKEIEELEQEQIIGFIPLPGSDGMGPRSQD
jgi:crotonobetainyl-CoA:carnitine CoA-transferase CaiB-like acyl-CoA transferase